ncbi:MAG: outer membrane beta-barrel protein [Gammaproteobacteria bacterium]
MRSARYVFPVLLMLPFAAWSAGDLSYTYLEADYVNLDVDAFGDAGDFVDDFDNGGGFAVRGSFAFGRALFGFADFSRTDADTNFVNDQGLRVDADQDVERVDVGVGLALPLAERADFVGRAAYTDIDFGDFAFGATASDDDVDDLREDSSDGYFADARLRAQLTDRLEGSVGARYTDVQSADNVSLIGNVLFELTPNLGINLEVDAGDELKTYYLGARYSFARF